MANQKFKMSLSKHLVHVEANSAEDFSVHLAGDYMNITDKLTPKQYGTVKKAVDAHFAGKKFGRGPAKQK